MGQITQNKPDKNCNARECRVELMFMITKQFHGFFEGAAKRSKTSSNFSINNKLSSQEILNMFTEIFVMFARSNKKT